MMRVSERLDHWTTPTSNLGKSTSQAIAGALIGLVSFKTLEGLLVCSSIPCLLPDLREHPPISPRMKLISAIVFASLKTLTEHYEIIPAPISYLTAFVPSFIFRNPDIGGFLIATVVWGAVIKYALFPLADNIVSNHSDIANYSFSVIEHLSDKICAVSQIYFGAMIGKFLPHAILSRSRVAFAKLAFFSLIATTFSVSSYYFDKNLTLNVALLGGSILIRGAIEMAKLLNQQPAAEGVQAVPIPPVAPDVQVPPHQEPRQEPRQLPNGNNSNNSPPVRRACSPQSMSMEVRPPPSQNSNHSPRVELLSFEKGIPRELHEDMIFNLAKCLFTGCPIFDFALDPTDSQLYERALLEKWVIQNERSPRTSAPLSVNDILRIHSLNEVTKERAEFYRAKLLLGKPIVELLQTPPEHSAKIKAALIALDKNPRFEKICSKLRTILQSIDDPQDWDFPDGQIPPRLYDDCLFSLFLCEHSKKPICNFVTDGNLLYEESEVGHLEKKFEKLNPLSGLVKGRLNRYTTLISLGNASKEAVEHFKRTPPELNALNAILQTIEQNYPNSIITQKLHSLLPNN